MKPLGYAMVGIKSIDGWQERKRRKKEIEPHACYHLQWRGEAEHSAHMMQWEVET
jgi:hypothetical protein